jgi:hypothetical protein
MAMINDTNEFACSPSPNGLPGGYPIRINAQGAEVVLPDGISMEEALKINMDGLRMEGVEAIKEDGTIVITEKANALIKELYGIDLKEIRFDDLEEMAREMITIRDKLAEKYSKA